MGTFSTTVNPSLFLEHPAAGSDPAHTDTSMVRPPTGSVTVQVRDHVTSNALSPMTSLANGYLSGSYPGTDLIDIMAPGGSWVGPIMSAELTASVASFAASITTASTNAATALSQVTTMLAAVPFDIFQNADGSWPARTDVAGGDNRVRSATWKQVIPGSARPPLGPGAAQAVPGRDGLEEISTS